MNLRVVGFLTLLGCSTDKEIDDSGGISDAIDPSANAGADRYAEVGTDITFSIGDSIGVRFIWDFGDGASAEGENVIHRYSEAGRKRAVLTAIAPDGRKKTDAATIVVHTPPTAEKALVSSAMIQAQGRLWMAFPEGDAIIAVDPNSQLTETIEVCDSPARLAAMNGFLAVSCPEADEIRLIDMDSREQSIWAFEAGESPFGIIGKDDNWWVSLRGKGLLQRWKNGVLQEQVSTHLSSDLRDISLSHDGILLVPRWRSQGNSASILRFNAESLEAMSSISLPKDQSGDSDNTTNGIPNLLGEVRPSPDGETLYIPMLHANIDRGLHLNGKVQTHETMLRAVLARLPSNANEDNPADREQFDERGRASSALPSPLGDTIYTLHPSSQHITILDAVSFETIGAILNVGAMPLGMTIDEAGETLFVYAWLDRSLSAFDVQKPHLPTEIWRINLILEEPLAENVLAGKRMFFDAQDTRITKSGYIACSNCHPAAEHDGQTWDFSDRGEGLRNTQTLRGVANTGQIHWTGNFDEFQDFEHDFRGAFSGTGFLSDEIYENTSPLSEPKAGQSEELDSLAAYMNSLTQTPRSPFPHSVEGENAFIAAGCDSCHIGSFGTDSNIMTPIRHDVGTATTASGGRLGEAYDGFDTPTLNGLWATPPYLHDGSAETLFDAILAHDLPEINPLNETETQDIVDYLLSR